MTSIVVIIGNVLLRMRNSSIDAQAVEVIGTMQSLGYLSPDELAARDNATANAALDRAATVCRELGVIEQSDYGLDRGTQNYFRARNVILALKSTTQAQRDAMAKLSSEEKRLELE